MFLHIGENTVIPLKDIISIFKPEEEPLWENEFLKSAEEAGFVIQLGQKPISCVITSKRVYLSPISVQTLSQRVRKSCFT